MKILFTGKPNKGSWQIRAVQMASGFADCIPFASASQCKAADFIVAVKRVPLEVLRAIQESGRPWAWDSVDAYPQPHCANWSREDSIKWARDLVASMRPTTTCWANLKMREDVGLGGEVIPHHHRPGISINPVRKVLKTVGYEGSPRFLGSWEHHLHHAAASIGAIFDPQAPTPSACDVVVAFRGGAADSYPARNWKSNVKLANAHASGTPFMGQPDAGYLETQTGMEFWVEHPRMLAPALDALVSYERRVEISNRFKVAAISLQQCQQMWLQIAKAHV